MRVLLVEDDFQIAGAARSALARRGMAVDWVSTGKAALSRVRDSDVVLLDLGLPDGNGIDLCREIRNVSDVAIIVVSARGEVDDRVQGLRAGADDYVVKPYNMDELLERAHAVQRRRNLEQEVKSKRIRFGDVEIDQSRYEVSVGGEQVELSRKEFQLLAVLARANGCVCTRERLIADVWGEAWSGANRTLDVHLAWLRTKLNRPGLIVTVRGVGYRLGEVIAGHAVSSVD